MIELLKKVYRKMLSLVLAPVFTEIRKISSEKSKPEYLKLIERSYNAGFEYHQKEIKRNPELLKWILKDNYMEKD